MMRQIRLAQPYEYARLGLIELMIAVTIGLVLIGALSVFVNSRQTYRPTGCAADGIRQLRVGPN